MYKEVKIKWSIFIININFLYKNLINKFFRLLSYYKLRLARLPASSYAISSGFACGSMVSFTPLLGLHFILAVVFAFLIRGNFIAALIGTIVGNPLTFPLIWGLIYKVGTFVISIERVDLKNDISFEMIINQTYEIFFPMLVGGIIVAPVVWIVTYFTIYSFISSYKKRKNKKTKRSS